MHQAFIQRVTADWKKSIDAARKLSVLSFSALVLFIHTFVFLYLSLQPSCRSLQPINHPRLLFIYWTDWAVLIIPPLFPDWLERFPRSEEAVSKQRQRQSGTHACEPKPSSFYDSYLEESLFTQITTKPKEGPLFIWLVDFIFLHSKKAGWTFKLKIICIYYLKWKSKSL